MLSQHNMLCDDNFYYNSFLEFLQTYENIEFIKIDIGKVYSCDEVYFIQHFPYFRSETLSYAHE